MLTLLPCAVERRSGSSAYAYLLGAALAACTCSAGAQDDLEFLFAEPVEASAQSARDESERDPDDGEGGTDASVAGNDDLETIPVGEKDLPDIVQKSERHRGVSRLVEEIVVTAQKREENIQNVPLSVSAFSADFLDVKGIQNTKDLPKITPGLTITQQVGFTTVYLRGVGSDTFLLGDPSVAVYVDEVYQPFAMSIAQDFGAIDRIEVLKGPQGTLFGRNALGGAIRVLTKDPSLDAPEFSGQVVLGQDATRDLRGYLSIPVLDTLAISVSGYRNRSDDHRSGHFDTVPFTGAGGIPLPEDVAKGLKGKIFWRPVDWLEGRLSYFDTATSSIGSLYTPNTRPSLLGRVAGIQPQDPYSGAVDGPARFELENQTLYGGTHFKLPWLDAKLFGSDQRIRTRQAYDFDGSPQPLAAFTGDLLFLDGRTAEVQLLSNANSLWADRVEWIFGAYYFDSTGGLDRNTFFVGGVNLGFGEVLGIKLPQPLLDAALALPIPLPTGQIEFTGILETESIAYFSQVNVDVTDWFALTLGARYQDEERALAKSTSGLRDSDGGVTNYQEYGADEDSAFRDATRSFDPKVSLNFRPEWGWLGYEALFYVSYQTATKSFTYNVVNLLGPPAAVRSEEIAAYEAGIKTDLLDGLVRLNAAVFHYDINDPQVQFVSLFNNGTVSFENAGAARVRGVDVDALIQLLPEMTDNGLVLTLSGAYLDSEYTDYRNGSGFDPQTGLFSRNNDYTGNQVVRTPRFSGTAGLSYTLRGARSALEFGVDYYYNSGFFFQASNSPADEQEAYALLAASVSYLYEPWNVRLTAFGSNITNEEYFYSRFITDFGTLDYVAPRAIYGLRLNVEY